MTVFNLITDQIRVREYWSSLEDIPLDLPLLQVDEAFKKHLITLQPPKNGEIKMKYIYESNSENKDALLIHLLPADVQSENILRNYRNELSKRTAIRFPNFENYKFHVSLAYLIEHLSPEEKKRSSSYHEKSR